MKREPIQIGQTVSLEERLRRQKYREERDRQMRELAKNHRSEAHACNCIGPQNGERVCPCRLRGEQEQGHRMITDGIIIDGVPYKLVPVRK